MPAPVVAAAGALAKKAAVQFAKSKAIQGVTSVAKIGGGGKQDPGQQGGFNRVVVFLVLVALVASVTIAGAVHGVATAVSSISLNHNADGFCSHVGSSMPGVVDFGGNDPGEGGTGEPGAEAGGAGVAPNAGSLVFPLPSGTFTTTSQYGMRVHPITGKRKLHRGTDYAGKIGTPVLSLADGVVASAEVQTHNKNNKVVRVRHNIGGQTITTSYLHLNSYSVKKGDTVKAGQQIAQLGNTGGSTGPHLHFEVWNGTSSSQSTNPATWLSKNGVAPRGGPSAPPSAVEGIYDIVAPGAALGTATGTLSDYEICGIEFGTGLYPGSGALAPGADGTKVVEIATRFIGLPYVLGASNPNASFDCSGLTSYVYSQVGVKLPRTSEQQRHAGRNITKAELKAGDLIWTPGHIAIYIGNGMIIDASSSVMEVMRRPMWQSESEAEYIRVLPSNDQPASSGGGAAPQPNLPQDRNNNRSIAYNAMIAKGWPASEFQCLDKLWMRESTWNHLAQNKSSGAYGIPQSLPASKMASHGSDYRTNPNTQIAWGLDYIKGRYGNPCGAWAHSERKNWY